MKKIAFCLVMLSALGAGYALALEATPPTQTDPESKGSGDAEPAVKCWPTRNVGIAETADHYRADCQQELAKDKASGQP
jgi:hypothetical protein